MTRVLVTGDYQSLRPDQKVPSRGTAIGGVRLYEDGQHLGTVCRPLTYIVEPDGDHLRIYYTPEGGA